MIDHDKDSGHRIWGWCPFLVLPLTAIACRRFLLPWVFMWTLAIAIYFALKWLTWWQARLRVQHSPGRALAYLLAWPGMDAGLFLRSGRAVTPPSALSWASAALKMIAGGVLLWVIARHIPTQNMLVRGWTGMVGLILLLHFGSFEILAFVWQASGIAAEPIMRSPLRSTSLAEFWGKRWNLGFRVLAHELIFRPTSRRLGTGVSGLLVFAASGLIHDLVISLPARGGYGFPTLYFLLQGIGVILERSSAGAALRLAQGSRGRLFTAVILAAPIFWLFHPPFVERVILPFMQAIHAI